MLSVSFPSNITRLFAPAFFFLSRISASFIMLHPVAFLALIAVAQGHTVAWVKGMYCLGGPDLSTDNANTNTAVGPLYNLTHEKWWFQHDRGCDAAPPAHGDILQLPAGGTFTVELAHNRAQTTLSYDGKYTSEWPDGKEHPEDWAGPGSPPTAFRTMEQCIPTTNPWPLALRLPSAISLTWLR